MSQSQKLTGPMMRRATGFNADKARSQLGKKRQNLRATDRSADDNIAQCVHCMDLKNVLRQIKANGANFHDGWLLRSCDASITSTLWRPDAVSGSHPHHLLWRSRTTSLSGDYGRKAELAKEPLRVDSRLAGNPNLVHRRASYNSPVKPRYRP